jgi:hypothetical protein
LASKQLDQISTIKEQICWTKTEIAGIGLAKYNIFIIKNYKNNYKLHTIFKKSGIINLTSKNVSLTCQLKFKNFQFLMIWTICLSYSDSHIVPLLANVCCPFCVQWSDKYAGLPALIDGAVPGTNNRPHLTKCHQTIPALKRVLVQRILLSEKYCKIH